MDKITDLSEQLRNLADTLVDDEWDHPLCSVETCRTAAYVLDWINERVFERQLNEVLGLGALVEGFAWNKEKADAIMEEYWKPINEMLKEAAEAARERK